MKLVSLIGILVLPLILMVGCRGDDTVTPTETETVEVTNRYVGEDVYFEMGGSFLEGYVVEGVSADEVRVRLDDNSEMVISVDQIGGRLIADHPDLETEVVLLGDKQKGEDTFSGRIVGVYDDGMRKIEIYSMQFLDGESEPLTPRRILFVPKDTPFEDGGYLTTDEYVQWLGLE